MCTAEHISITRELRAVLEVTPLDSENVDKEVLSKNSWENTKLVWFGSPTDPTLKFMDVSQIACCPSFRPLLFVDNTFVSALCSSPLILGADIVLHSLRQYVNGHADVQMGAVVLPQSSSEGHTRFKDKFAPSNHHRRHL
ncbi:hypothetical protein EST38_g8957 [Candolleomyces aberdarensis]|uniref:cystathionine gamma-lyase n=1 Tax=Candolleomyces aberdarensis TaxID=2316362 RepID=A0A4Q2DBC6_9AGAR|nr:hypothetical protein EST38_g8957 [Candolleomyces aberdarensis]